MSARSWMQRADLGGRAGMSCYYLSIPIQCSGGRAHACVIVRTRARNGMHRLHFIAAEVQRCLAAQWRQAWGQRRQCAPQGVALSILDAQVTAANTLRGGTYTQTVRTYTYTHAHECTARMNSMIDR